MQWEHYMTYIRHTYMCMHAHLRAHAIHSQCLRRSARHGEEITHRFLILIALLRAVGGDALIVLQLPWLQWRHCLFWHECCRAVCGSDDILAALSNRISWCHQWAVDEKAWWQSVILSAVLADGVMSFPLYWIQNIFLPSRFLCYSWD